MMILILCSSTFLDGIGACHHFFDRLRDDFPNVFRVFLLLLSFSQLHWVFLRLLNESMDEGRTHSKLFGYLKLVLALRLPCLDDLFYVGGG